MSAGEPRVIDEPAGRDTPMQDTSDPPFRNDLMTTAMIRESVAVKIIMIVTPVLLGESPCEPAGSRRGAVRRK
jgi:hypothetical protein